MINKLLNDIPELLLIYISDDWMGYIECLENKNEFRFKVTPDIFYEYCEKDTHMYGIDYHGGINKRLQILEQLGVIEKYHYEGALEFNKEEWIDYFNRNNLHIDTDRFFYAYLSEGNKYKLSYDLRKLEKFQKILYKKDKLKFNIKNRLLNTLSFLIEKEHVNSTAYPTLNIFDVKTILDEIELKNNHYIFYDSEVLIHSIALIDNLIYIAKFLNYVVNSFKGSDLEILINAIKSETNLYYFSDDDIERSKQSQIEINTIHHLDISPSQYQKLENSIIDMDKITLVGNIGYTKDVIEDKSVLNNDKVVYNNCILEFVGKKVNFSQAKKQKDFIEKLYANINNWVSDTELECNGQQILKDIRNKMKKKSGGGFTNLETKKLFQEFEDNKNRYFIMIG